MTNQTKLISLLEMIDAKIEHIEDITADNREVIIRLVKQSNQIVQFLKQIEIEDVTDEFENISAPPLSKSEEIRSNRMQHIKELVDDFMDKAKGLRDFEEELKKHKDELTPGTIGES